MVAGDARRRCRARCPAAITGLSIDSRTIAPGEAYFAIKGDVHDGHDFVDAALKAGAGARGGRSRPARQVRRRRAAFGGRRRARRPRRSGACFARAARRAQVIAVTGSVGKTSTKEALRLRARRARRDPCLGGVVQQSLGRAAVAGALPGACALCDLRDRHEPRRRNRCRW